MKVQLTRQNEDHQAVEARQHQLHVFSIVDTNHVNLPLGQATLKKEIEEQQARFEHR